MIVATKKHNYIIDGKNKIRIELIDHGIAYTVFQNGVRWIQINKALLDYPDLYDLSIKHELGHIRRNGFLSNILYDFIDSFRLSNFKLIEFQLKNPNSFISNLPIYKDKDGWCFNVTMITMWSLLIIALLLNICI